MKAINLVLAAVMLTTSVGPLLGCRTKTSKVEGLFSSGPAPAKFEDEIFGAAVDSEKDPLVIWFPWSGNANEAPGYVRGFNLPTTNARGKSTSEAQTTYWQGFKAVDLLAWVANKKNSYPMKACFSNPATNRSFQEGDQALVTAGKLDNILVMTFDPTIDAFKAAPGGFTLPGLSIRPKSFVLGTVREENITLFKSWFTAYNDGGKLAPTGEGLSVDANGNAKWKLGNGGLNFLQKQVYIYRDGTQITKRSQSEWMWVTARGRLWRISTPFEKIVANPKAGMIVERYVGSTGTLAQARQEIKDFKQMLFAAQANLQNLAVTASLRGIDSTTTISIPVSERSDANAAQNDVGTPGYDLSAEAAVVLTQAEADSAASAAPMSDDLVTSSTTSAPSMDGDQAAASATDSDASAQPEATADGNGNGGNDSRSPPRARR